MLFYGNRLNIQNQCTIYNFTSMVEGYDRLRIIPPNNLGAINEYDFDVNYYNFIMSDNYRFAQVFNIVNKLRLGEDVYLIISEDQWSEMLAESLLKMIQQRYGFNAIRVNCFEDVYNVENTGDIRTIDNIRSFDEDMERYELIMGSCNLAQGALAYAT